MSNIPDEHLKYIILGCYRGIAALEAFPIKVREIRENTTDDGTIESFTIVTFSGLKFTTHAPTFDGQE